MLTPPAHQIACLIRVPTEVVKSLAQTSGAAHAGRTGSRSWGEAVALGRREGLRGFYRGFGITVAREVSLGGTTSAPLFPARAR